MQSLECHIQKFHFFNLQASGASLGASEHPLVLFSLCIFTHAVPFGWNALPVSLPG